MTKDTFIVTKQSPFHWMNTMVTGGREWTKMEHTRNIFFDKVNKAQMINKMKIGCTTSLMARPGTTSSTTTLLPRLPSSSPTFPTTWTRPGPTKEAGSTPPTEASP